MDEEKKRNDEVDKEEGKEVFENHHYIAIISILYPENQRSTSFTSTCVKLQFQIL